MFERESQSSDQDKSLSERFRRAGIKVIARLKGKEDDELYDKYDLDQGKRLSRRDFLTMSLGLTGAAALAAAGLGNTDEGVRLPLSPTETPDTSPPRATPKLSESSASPTPKATEIPYPSPTPEPPIPSPSATARPTEVSRSSPASEEKLIRELPKGIIPKKELEEKYHVFIHNLPDTELLLRESILEQQKPLFDWLLKQAPQPARVIEWNPNKPGIIAPLVNEPPRRLDIILINSATLTAEGLSEEQKKILGPRIVKSLSENDAKIRGLAREFYQKSKTEGIQRYNQALARLEAERKSNTIPDSTYQARLNELKYWYRPYLQDESIPLSLEEISRAGVASAAGVYIEEDSAVDIVQPDGKPRKEDRRIILLPVGDFRTDTPFGETLIDPTFSPEINYPKASDFPITADQEYPVAGGPGGKNIFFRIWHEALHGSGYNHPHTDTEAVRRMQQAYEHMKATGDDSKYPFVFIKKSPDKPNEIYVGKMPEENSSLAV